MPRFMAAWHQHGQNCVNGFESDEEQNHVIAGFFSFPEMIFKNEWYSKYIYIVLNIALKKLAHKKNLLLDDIYENEPLQKSEADEQISHLTYISCYDLAIKDIKEWTQS